jgi:glycosyltransferase involved in cell wall biosynthesis
VQNAALNNKLPDPGQTGRDHPSSDIDHPSRENPVRACNNQSGIPGQQSEVATRRTRVLQVASTLHVGGAEMVIADLARFIDRSRFDASVCYLRENGVVGRLLEKDGIHISSLSARGDVRTDYLTSLRLRRFVREHSIEIIHSHDTHGLVDCSIVRCLVPSVRHIHTFHFGNYPNLSSDHARFERLVWRRPDRLIAVGTAQARSIEAFYRMKSGRLRILRNGVTEHRPITDDSLARLAASRRMPVVASISTLTAQKGISHLLEAVSILKSRDLNVLLLVAGDGRLRQSLEQQAATLGVTPNVEFVGWLPEAARRLLPNCDIFVQSSLWEAMSIVVLEAMAAAKPLVVTSVGENPHILRHRESALLVPPGDSESLAEAIGELLVNRSLASRLGAQARADYESEHRVLRMIKKYEVEYASLARAD